MFRLFRRTWKYTVALLGRRFEDAADPEIQIEQAIEEGKRQHAMLVQQAAAVIGNQHEVELKLGRTIDQVESLRSSAREALRLADEAQRAGDELAATGYEETAQSFAVALVSTEAQMRDLKVLHDHAVDGAAAAKDAVETNALELRRRLTERTRLLSQLDQAKLQERMNSALGSMSALAPEADVPSFDRIRDKIERRYSQALGVAEIGSTTIEVRALNVQKASLDAEAALQLARLRSGLLEGDGSE
jgi:phage shock protein A